MADLIYDYGLDEWRTWTTGTFEWMGLQDTYTPSRTHHYVSDVNTHEIGVSGYARDTVTTPARTVNTTLHRITYDCDDPNFGSPVAGETVGYVVLYQLVTNDSDSILLALYDIGDFATDGGLFSPVIGAEGAHYIDQG